MTESESVKTRDSCSSHLYVPTVGRGELDVVNNRFKIVPNRGHLEESRGTLFLEGKLPEKKAFSLEYRLNNRGMDTYRALNDRLDLLGKEGTKDDTKWPSLKGYMDQLIQSQEMRGLLETLGDWKQSTLLQGDVKYQRRLIENLDCRVTELFTTLDRKVQTLRDGVDFVRHLLDSGNDDQVLVGLHLVRDHLVGPLQHELERVFQNRSHSASLRRLSFAFLHRERQQSVLLVGKHRWATGRPAKATDADSEEVVSDIAKLVGLVRAYLSDEELNDVFRRHLPERDRWLDPNQTHEARAALLVEHMVRTGQKRQLEREVEDIRSKRSAESGSCPAAADKTVTSGGGSLPPASAPEPVAEHVESKKPRCALNLYYCYSHSDERLREKLEEHLALLQRGGVIDGWHDRRIGAGQEWKGQIDEHLDSASIILLLISASFLASDYCYDEEMKRALQRHKDGKARVIPVIIRPTDNRQSAPFGGLHVLPRDGKPVVDWPRLDDAFADIARGIRAAALELLGEMP
jgi:hypothetical protein